MPKPSRDTLLLGTLAALFTASIAIGAGLHGWLGALLYPIALFFLLLTLLITFMLLNVPRSLRRRRELMRQLAARVQDLASSDLETIIATPGHRDFQFAVLELMKRGSASRPSCETLFAMLLSPQPQNRIVAITHLSTFHPEVQLPPDSSSSDPPEVWARHIETMRAKLSGP